MASVKNESYYREVLTITLRAVLGIAAMQKRTGPLQMIMAAVGLMLAFSFQSQAEGTSDFRHIVRRMSPFVIRISGYMGHDQQRPYANASGLFVEDRGLVITVPNVFTDYSNRRLCEHYRIRLFDGRVLRAEMFSVDPVLNVAILKLTEPGVYPVAVKEHRVGVEPGERVLAITGRSSDHPPVFAIGYVTAKERKSAYGSGFGDMLINGRMQLPVDAYGGPLVNEAGEVVGIITHNIYISDPQAEDPNDIHALPINVAMGFLRVAKVFPTSRQNWIGLSIRPLNPEEQVSTYNTLGKRAGLYVDFVWSEGPAVGSDIRPGDILFEINGKALSDMHSLNKLLLSIESGTMVELAILREGRGYPRRVRTEVRPSWAAYVR